MINNLILNYKLLNVYSSVKKSWTYRYTRKLRLKQNHQPDSKTQTQPYFDQKDHDYSEENQNEVISPQNYFYELVNQSEHQQPERVLDNFGCVVNDRENYTPAVSQ